MTYIIVHIEKKKHFKIVSKVNFVHSKWFILFFKDRKAKDIIYSNDKEKWRKLFEINEDIAKHIDKMKNIIYNLIVAFTLLLRNVFPSFPVDLPTYLKTLKTLIP